MIDQTTPSPLFSFSHAVRALRTLVAVTIALSAAMSFAESHARVSPAGVTYDATTRVFRLEAADTSYVIGINEKGGIQTLYWGKRLRAADHLGPAQGMPAAAAFDQPITTTPQEFVGWGGGLYVEPDLKITFPDGNRDLVLKYVSHTFDGDRLNLVMKDISREAYVTLEYELDQETGILRRSAKIENRTDQPFTIEQVAAGTWNLPRGTEYRLRYLTGRWAGEWNVQEQPIRPGETVLESRRGTTVPRTIRGSLSTSKERSIRTTGMSGSVPSAGAAHGK